MSCGTTHQKPETPNVQEQFTNIAPGDSLLASIYRSPCYGTCANYRLSIYNSGYAVYEGKRNAKMIGIFTTKFTYSEMKQLLIIAENIKYTELEDEYDNKNVTDLPSTTTSLVMNGKRKEVKCRIGCPTELSTFQNEFDSLVANNKWTEQVVKE